MNRIERIKFISEMHQIKLMGGNKRTYAEVLLREVKKGNTKAIKLYEKWKDKL